MIVGIALTSAELMGGHLSVARSLMEVRLNRMSEEELENIITKGEDRTKILFTPTVKNPLSPEAWAFHILRIFYP